jgi:hypothetical protein
MLLTFGEVKTSPVAEVAGTCVEGDQFKARVNEAIARLLPAGDWDGSVIPMLVGVTSGCVVFPRWVGRVRKMNFCGHRVPLKNNWYEFMEFPPGGWNSLCHQLGASRMSATALGETQVPVFQQVIGEGRYIRVYPRCQADAGKIITIFGVDNNGEALRHQNDMGDWVDGLELMMSLPYVSTDIPVRRIDRVLRDATQCPVDMYGYFPDDDALESLAMYEPSEINPSLTSYRLNFLPADGVARCVLAMVKLRHIPVSVDSDLVPIKNLYALKDMVQSIREKEAGNIDLAAKLEAAALRTLNLELRDANPDEQVSIDVRAFGTAFPAKHGIGRIY